MALTTNTRPELLHRLQVMRQLGHNPYRALDWAEYDGEITREMANDLAVDLATTR